MKKSRSFLRKSAFIFAFSLVVFCQSYSLEAKEKEYIITESQLQAIEQNNSTILNESEELKKQQKAQMEYSKKLENEKLELQKEVEKEKAKSKKLGNAIPIAFVAGATGMAILTLITNK